MKHDKLLKRLNINKAQLEQIKTAVAETEKTTTGEIALAAVYQSDSYAFVELFAAFCTAFVSFFILLLFSNPIWKLLDRTFWYPAPSQLTAAIGFAVICITAAVYLLLNIPAIDRLIIPRKLKERRVYARALRHFVESGVYKTADRTGILIFISVLERKIFIIADSGINEKVLQNQWDGICKIMTNGLRTKNTAKAFITATEECGKILQKYFPTKIKNPNELADGLVILEH